MTHSQSRSARVGRYLLSAAIAALGLVAIVGSGGGGGELASMWVPKLDPPPRVTVTPDILTVAVGGTAAFTATVTDARSAPTYQWLRDGATIAGATGPTYTLTGANLGDDSARFMVQVAASNGTAFGSGLLQVSPLPGVVVEDGDFTLTNWVVAAVADPAQNGPTQAVSRSDTGGNPDAYRKITYSMPAGASSISVYHTLASPTYEPSVQGPIYVIDAGMDCDDMRSAAAVSARALLEQAGRRFTTSVSFKCGADWKQSAVLGLRAEDFTLVDGPACGSTETCPDFSARGAPIRFGFRTRASNSSTAAAAGTSSQGIDNWKVTVWRK